MPLRRVQRAWQTAVLALGITACGGGGGADPPSASQQHLAGACAAAASRVFGGATLTAATVVTAGGAVPAYCQVRAQVDPQLQFVLRLPANWNGKLHYAGGGGYNGSIPPLAGTSLSALVKGYASVASDSGHQGDVFDASWVVGDAQAAQRFGYSSIPTVMAAALEITRTVWGQVPSHSYFEGCSGGGREALMMAQRYPNLFDGIIARAPAFNWTAMMGAFNRTAKAVALAEGQFPASKTNLLAAALRGACDAADGIADGVVSRPSACTFDPRVLRCTGGADTGGNCLSDAQLGFVETLTSTASFANGDYTYPGRPLSGNEDALDGWPAWVTGSGARGGNGIVRTAGQYLLQDTTIKSYLAANSAIDSLAYSPYDQNPTALAWMASLNDATNTDLRPLAASNGKLIVWHGGSDPAVGVTSSIGYVAGVTSAAGGRATADAFMRLYVAPGVAHCSGGPGADEVDLLTPLDSWVRGAGAPGDLVASKVIEGNVASTRPLCVHPNYPRYFGPAGDAAAARLAANYACTPP